MNPLHLSRMVINPFRNRLQYVLESMLISGTLARLAVAAGLIALTAVIMGLLGFFVALGSDQSFRSVFEAIWWAFLRLSDPGYLGDDEGFLLRVVSTLVTVAGYVLFLGVLVAILTQGLNERIHKIELGLTPVSVRNHVIFLGWSSRTPVIVRTLLASKHRLGRFLRRVGVKRLKLLMLVEQVTHTHKFELRSFLGDRWKAGDIIFRSGSPLRLDHLKRVDYLNASAIVLPAQERGLHRSASQSDNAAIKTILSISHSMRLSGLNQTPPLLVAELYDARKIPVALRSYRGPIEAVAGDEVVSRMLAQMIHHPGISHVFRELLSHAYGNEVYARDCPTELEGTPFWDLAERLQTAVLMGVTRLENGIAKPVLNPSADFRFEKGDKLVYVARDWADGYPPKLSKSARSWPEQGQALDRHRREDLKILVLGWSRRVPALLSELEDYAQQRHKVTIASRIPMEERQKRVQHYGFQPEQTEIVQIDADYTIPEKLAALNPAGFDVVICLASDMTQDDQEADARTLVAHAVLKDLLEGASEQPRILLELLDELNVALVESSDCEYLLAPQILSHMLVQVTLRRELNPILQELFNSSSKEIRLRDYRRYRLESDAVLTFPEIQKHARKHKEIALGILKQSEADNGFGGVQLNPERRRSWTLEPGDQLVVLKG